MIRQKDAPIIFKKIICCQNFQRGFDNYFEIQSSFYTYSLNIQLIFAMFLNNFIQSYGVYIFYNYVRVKVRPKIQKS